MKVTALDILTAEQGIGELMGAKLPVATSFKLARLAKAIGAEGKVIAEERNKLIRQYGTTDEKGNSRVAPEMENWAAYVKDVNALYQQEVELDVQPVELPAVLEVSPGAILAVDKFITMA